MFDLQSSAVRLRAFRDPGDLDDIVGRFYNDIRVAPLITQKLIVPRGDKLKEEFKESIKNDAEMFCIIETLPGPISESDTSDSAESTKKDPEFVGFTAFWGHRERGHRHVNFSLVLRPEFWGKGIGREVTEFMINHAFLHLNMHRISLEVYEGNDRAAALYRKCGFVDEGLQRKIVWVNGGWRDIIHMGILVEDWRENRLPVIMNKAIE